MYGKYKCQYSRSGSIVCASCALYVNTISHRNHLIDNMSTGKTNLKYVPDIRN